MVVDGQVGAFDRPTPRERELTTAQAAELLGVDPATLRRYPIPFTQYRPRSTRRYRLADLERFRDSRLFRPVEPVD